MATFPTGSLGKHLRDTIAAACSGVGTEDSVQWSSRPADGPYVPNGDFWLPRITCVSQLKPMGAVNGCLITPKHLATARHTSQGWPGTVLRFCAADGTLCDRTSTARTLITGTDIAIITLNADVDAGITPAKLLPANIDDILVGRYRDPVPGVVVNRSRDAMLMSIYPLMGEDYHHEPNPDMLAARTGSSLDSPYSGMAYTPIWGDSGSPWLMLVNGAWCLIGCMNSSSSAPAMHKYYTEIAAITGEGYAPQVADLSGFTVPDAVEPEAESDLPLDVPFPVVSDLGGGMASIVAFPTSIVLDDSYGTNGLNYDVPWTNKDNAAAEDGSVATDGGFASGGGNGDAEGPRPMNAVAFDFSAIPSDATITGFLVRKKDRRTTTGYSHLETSGSDRTSLVRDATEYGEVETTGQDYTSGHVGTAVVSSGQPSTTLGWRSWGGDGELFGRTWTVAQVKSAHFGPKFLWAWQFDGGAASTYELDSIEVTVYYTEAASGDPSPSPIVLTGTDRKVGRSAILRRRFR